VTPEPSAGIVTRPQECAAPVLGRADQVNAARGGGQSRPAVLSLAADLQSVRAARHFVGRECGALRLSPEHCDDALLLVSELVTNAVLHGRSDVCVEVSTRSDTVRIAVLDENSRHPAPVSEDPDALDGRGLALVDAVAARWGVEDRPIGKAVWFELSRS
jgi:anti-sigma regulatory factor (Ser/Thr protein kinase)